MTAAAGELRPLRCERAGCAHGYLQHAPGGGNCLFWFPPDPDSHCECVGFRFVPLETGHAPPRSAS